MGKKRRVLRSPKFAHLRKHPKYAGMVASNEQAKEESQESAIVEEQPTPVLDIVATQTETIEPEPVVKAVKEKPKPKPRKTRKKATTAKKRTAKRKPLKSKPPA